MKCAVGVALVLSVVIEVRAKQPIFVSWLVADDPGDQTILHYWERYELEELSPTEMVDLGTMLFYRGYPKDAIRILESALDQDKELHEAWFRIGLVEHQQGDLREARIAYKRCLKLFKGHGWCNFYLGLLEEQETNSKKAMEYYRAAFRYAPVLADPEVNPEMASSDLSLGAWLMMARDRSFKGALPMPYLHPNRVHRIKEGFTEVAEQAKAEKIAERKAKKKADKVGTVEEAGDSSATGGKAKLIPVTKATKTPKSKPSRIPRETTPKKPSGGETPRPSASPPSGTAENDTPYGLPGNRNASSDAYPGF
ncbi:MAG: tetratricopeptide repeat protein [Acidobacteriota bacterium]